ncbi:hypothetical protein H2200_012876 [Cladophialophora chaetospira]|uniref:Uncharacterized protein n=1 Tax=Cladophialophora chaetospira TaxID=386627 RepID=A0AA38WX17_9EURO|nr:hypothetical protein H2200_012876 [Cladophialophora chaetospira]
MSPPLHTSLALLSVLWLPICTQAHMQMSSPYPLRSPLDPDVPVEDKDYSMTSPLFTDGSNFPCKNYQNYSGGNVTKATYVSGGSYDMWLNGTVTHDGGSCQLSLSYDNGATFKVIKSIIGGCPLDPHFNFTIPQFAPSSDSALLSWSWFNLIGNREMYQNCARVKIISAPAGKQRRGSPYRRQASSMDQLPDMFACDVGNGCQTIERREVVFPDPGNDVVYGQDAITPDPGPGYLIAGGSTTSDLSTATTSGPGSTSSTVTVITSSDSTSLGATSQTTGFDTSATTTSSESASTTDSSSFSTTSPSSLTTTLLPTISSSVSAAIIDSTAGDLLSTTSSTSASSEPYSTSVSTTMSSITRATSTSTSSSTSNIVSDGMFFPSPLTTMSGSTTAPFTYPVLNITVIPLPLSTGTGYLSASSSASSDNGFYTPWTTSSPTSTTTTFMTSFSAPSSSLSSGDTISSSGTLLEIVSSTPSSSYQATSTPAISISMNLFSTFAPFYMPTSSTATPSSIYQTTSTATISMDYFSTYAPFFNMSTSSTSTPSSVYQTTSIPTTSVNSFSTFAPFFSTTTSSTTAPTTLMTTTRSTTTSSPLTTATALALPCVPGTFTCDTPSSFSQCISSPSSLDGSTYVYMGSVAAGMTCVDGQIIRQNAGACTPSGQLFCNGERAFYLCDQGGLIDMGPVTPGTACRDGVIGYE